MIEEDPLLLDTISEKLHLFHYDNKNFLILGHNSIEKMMNNIILFVY